MSPKTIGLTGGTGFIGRALAEALTLRGYEVRIFTRHEVLHPPEWIYDCDVIIHLAGAPIAKRWTGRYKRLIRESRIGIADRLYSALRLKPSRLTAWISASAIGFYGDSGENQLTESSLAGSGFLSEVCQQWEASAQQFDTLEGVRHVCIRTGMVLGADGGVLKQLKPLFSMGLGGRLGTGQQWISWVHLEDLVRIYLLAVDDHFASGAYNACSPSPIRQEDFAARIGSILHRPPFISTPSWVLKGLLGEMSHLLLDSQRVTPQKLIDHNFLFNHLDCRLALENCFK
jgi:uncharacterized protein (TIGR01777 family)